MLRWFQALSLTALAFAAACGSGDQSTARQPPRAAAPATVSAPSQPSSRADVSAGTRRADAGHVSTAGFRSRAQFNEHFQKHGSEFGHISQQEYLREAQSLRDAPAGANIEEIRRDDGTTSRYDRSTGAFLAFNRDGTIRTFFKPNDGEAYFRRQASRVH